MPSDQQQNTGTSPDETSQLVDRAAHAAAHAAVQEVFLSLGLDISTPESLIELQKVFAYMQRSSEMSDLIVKYGVTTVVTTILGGALTLVWLGLSNLFKH